MHENLTFYFDSCTRFHKSLYINGWAHGDSKPLLAGIVPRGKAVEKMSFEHRWDMSELGDVGKNAFGFEIQLLMDSKEIPDDLSITMIFSNYQPVTFTWDAIVRRAWEHTPRYKVWTRFNELVKSENVATMLDIGGRARSGVFKADEFPHLKVEVLDILSDTGVTHVGDAHRMSQIVGRDKYDAVMSTSVFEHLVMPWKVAVEMNRILKRGGLGFVHTHQSIGMHDMPWDFYRFSDNAWKGIFNHATGFEILQTEMANMNYIIPCMWEDRHFEAERARGFESSAVLVRKIGECELDWPLTAADVTKDIYPE